MCRNDVQKFTPTKKNPGEFRISGGNFCPPPAVCLEETLHLLHSVNLIISSQRHFDSLRFFFSGRTQQVLYDGRRPFWRHVHHVRRLTGSVIGPIMFILYGWIAQHHCLVRRLSLPHDAMCKKKKNLFITSKYTYQTSDQCMLVMGCRKSNSQAIAGHPCYVIIMNIR